MKMKQMKTVEKKIGNCTFYLKPFPAFVAANISGDLATMLLPILGAMAPTIAVAAQKGGNENIMDTKMEDLDIDSAVPVLSKAMTGLTGAQVERFMKKLLIENRNVSVESREDEIELQVLDMDLANEIFCGDLQDMYILCYEVLKLNFSGFFKNLGTRFGAQISALMTEPSTVNTENLT